MDDLCSNGLVHVGTKRPAATTTVSNNGLRRLCDTCASSLATSKKRGDVLSERIVLTREPRPNVLAKCDWVEPDPDEAKAYDELNRREQKRQADASARADGGRDA